MNASEKKGNKSWKPAQKLSIVDKKAGYVYRWCDKDPANLLKRKADGWVMASDLHGHKAKQEAPEAKDLTSVTEYRDLVLMAIPEEDYQSHRDYYEEQTRKQTVGLKDRVKQDARQGATGKAADIHGTIVIN